MMNDFGIGGCDGACNFKNWRGVGGGRSASPEGERGVYSGMEMMNDVGIGGCDGAGARGRTWCLLRN